MKRFRGEPLDVLDELQRIPEDLVLCAGQRETSVRQTRNPVVKHTANENVGCKGRSRRVRGKKKSYQRTGSRSELHLTERKCVRRRQGRDSESRASARARKKNGNRSSAIWRGECVCARLNSHPGNGLSGFSTSSAARREEAV